MDILVIQSLQVIFLGTCSQIAFLVEISAQQSVDASEHSENSDIKLSFIHEEGFFNVLLNNDGPILPTIVLPLKNHCLNLLKA